MEEKQVRRISTGELCKLLSVSRMTISTWVNAGMPKLEHGTFDLLEAFPWWLQNIHSNKEDQDETIKDAKCQYWKAKAESTKIEVEKERDSLFPARKIPGEWAGRCREMKAGMEYLTKILSEKLPGMNQDEMRDVIADEVWKLLDIYSSKGRFTPKPKRKR